MFDWSLWYLFPVGIIIATLGMSSGVSGSNFWIPVYMVWLRVDPKVGFWLSLLTMTFGFGSGVWKNLRQGTIDGGLVRRYLWWCLPFGVLGGFLSPRVDQRALMMMFACFVLIYGLYLLVTWQRQPAAVSDTRGSWRRRTVAVLGAFLQGLVATGLGKLLLPQMLREPSMAHHARAVGSTVLVVFIVTLAAVLARLNGDFIDVLATRRHDILAIMLWTAPAVVLGGQLGPYVARQLPKKYLKPYVGGLLIVVGGLMMIRVFGG